MRAMPAKFPSAPLARAARKVDLARDSLSDPGAVFSFGHLADKLMPGGSGETVVAALKFEIGGADARAKKTDSRKSMRNARQRPSLDLHASRLQMNRKHRLMF
jgi:hypothetical protein